MRSAGCWAAGANPMFEKLVSFQNLYRAYKICLRRKRSTRAAQEIEPVYEKVLWRLKRELEQEIWRPAPYRAFAVTEPCLREIFAADFCDRIVHHALYNMINPLFEEQFIGQSYACREGKGTHSAVNDLRRALRASVTRGRKVWVLKMDIESFFMSIDRAVLLEIVSRTVKNPAVFRLAKTIICADPARGAVKSGDISLLDKVPHQKSLFGAPPGLGLPIGNLTSQLFANVYLNELDQFVKNDLRVKHYFRYVDDFIILGHSPKRLAAYKKRIDGFLQNKLRLRLHKNKTYIGDAGEGIDFLGYFIKPDYVLVRKKVVCRFKKRLKNLAAINIKEATPNALSVLNSYYSHFSHADSYRLRQHFCEKRMTGLKDFFAPKADFSSFYRRGAAAAVEKPQGL